MLGLLDICLQPVGHCGERISARSEINNNHGQQNSSRSVRIQYTDELHSSTCAYRLF
jgi:hypothetical protein